MIVNKDCKRVVIVPMKDPAEAKTRLKSSLTEAQRKSLAKLLFERTLKVLSQVQIDAGDKIFDVAVITGSEEISKLSNSYGCAVIDDSPVHSLNMAAIRASNWALENEYSSMCILPADLAAPDRGELTALLSTQLSERQILVCPSADQGTNALLVSPPDAVEFCYGPKSFNQHYLAAEKAGLRPIIASFESLKFDIDTSDDLIQLLEIAPDVSNILEQA